MRARRRRVGVRVWVLTAMAVSLVASGCVHRGPDPLAIGVKRIALNLAFSDEEKAIPIPPEEILLQLPIELPAELPPEIDLPERPPPARPRAIPLPGPTPCPAAPPGAAAPEPVPIFARSTPLAGQYAFHNEGTIKILAGAFALTTPYPRRSVVEIRNVVVQDEVPGGEALPPAVRSVAGISRVVTFDAYKAISGELSILDSYRYDEADFRLTKRVVTTDSGVTTFDPQPAITFMKFGRGEGDTWSSAGLDQEDNLGMVVQGTINNREFVDLCGRVVDAFHVTSTENVVDLSSGSQSGTDVQQPNVYWFANQLGALVVKEEGHFTQLVQVNGSPVTLEFDYTSTMDSGEPLAPAATAKR